MDLSNVSVIALVVLLFVAVAFWMILRGFKLPKDFHEKALAREQIRKRFATLSYENKEKEKQAQAMVKKGAAIATTALREEKAKIPPDSPGK